MIVKVGATAPSTPTLLRRWSYFYVGLGKSFGLKIFQDFSSQTL